MQGKFDQIGRHIPCHDPLALHFFIDVHLGALLGDGSKVNGFSSGNGFGGSLLMGQEG